MSDFFQEGITLLDQENYTDAIPAFLKSIEQNRDYEVYFNLGLCYFYLRDWQNSIKAFEDSLIYKSNCEHALYNIGLAFLESADYQNAIQYFDHVVTLSPEWAEAYYQKGKSLFKLDHFDDAILELEKALSLNRYLEMAAQLYEEIFFAQMTTCIWQRRDYDLRFLTILTQDYLSQNRLTPIRPFQSLWLFDDIVYQGILSENHLSYIYENHSPIFSQPEINFSAYRTKNRRIKIGWLSGACNNHPIGMACCGLFQYFDRSKFDVTIYHYGNPDQSYYYQLHQQGVERFLDLSHLDFSQLAQQIIDDQVDILIETNIHSAYELAPGREHQQSVTMFRLAPIQIYYLDFAGNLKAPQIDYVISDPVVIGQNEHLYHHKQIYLPHALGNSFQTIKPEINSITHEKAGIPEGKFVFASFNYAYKYEPDVFTIWMNILKAVPDSILWLYNKTPNLPEHIWEEATRAGVDPNRIFFRIPVPDYLDYYALVDLILDPLIYTGHITSLDALWMNRPILTFPGKTWSRRVTTSFLTLINIPELIAESHTEYEAKAVYLATHPEKINQLSDKIRQQKMPLFDTHKWVKCLEDGLLQAWENFIDNKPLQSFHTNTSTNT